MGKDMGGDRGRDGDLHRYRVMNRNRHRNGDRDMREGCCAVCAVTCCVVMTCTVFSCRLRVVFFCGAVSWELCCAVLRGVNGETRCAEMR